MATAGSPRMSLSVPCRYEEFRPMSRRMGMITLRFKDCTRRHLRCVSSLTQRKGNFPRSRGPASGGIDEKMGMPRHPHTDSIFQIFTPTDGNCCFFRGGDFGPSPFIFWQHVNVILTSARSNVKGKRLKFGFGSIAAFIFYFVRFTPKNGYSKREQHVR